MFSSVHGCRFAFSQWSSKVTFAYSQCVSERAFGIIFPFCTANSNTDWINYSTVTYQEALSECKALKERRDRNYSWNSNEKGHSYSISFFIFISHPSSYIKVTQKLERTPSFLHIFATIVLVLMLVSSKQLPIGRSQSWDVLGGNESQWERSENMYEQQNRTTDRRNSFGGDAGSLYEPPTGVRPSDMDMKREPYHYELSLYNQNYVDRLDPCKMRENSVPELNSHYERPPMTHRVSLTPLDPYQQDPAVFSRSSDGFNCGGRMPLNQSASHYVMMGRNQPLWNQNQSGRSSVPAPTPAPPPTHIYGEPCLPGPPPATPLAKMMPESQRIPSRAPSPARYAIEAANPRYEAEAPTSLPGCSMYSDLNGRPVDQSQPVATCLVMGSSSQGMVMRQESPSSCVLGQQQQTQQQKQEPAQQQLQQQMQQVQSFHQAQQFQPVQQPQQIQSVQQPQQTQSIQQVQQMPLVQQIQPAQSVQQGQLVGPLNPIRDPNPLLPAPASVTTSVTAVIPAQGPPQLPTQPAPPPTPQNSMAPVDPKKTADPEFVAFLRNEGLSECTITSLLQQGFDSTAMLAVMEQNDIHSVAPNLGQARVLSRVAVSCKRPPDITQHQSAPVRGRSNSFSHRSDLYMHQQPPMTPPLYQPPLTPVQTIFPRMTEVMGRRPSSAPSQHLLEASGYPVTRTPGSFSSAVLPVQHHTLSAYTPQAGLPMPSLAAVSQQVPLPSRISGVQPQILGLQQMPAPVHGMPQQTPALTGLPQSAAMPTLPAKQAPKAYSTNYTVPMELMKRDRNLATMSSLSNPQPSPHIMRKTGLAPHENSLVPVGAVIQTPSLANQKLSRRTGPPVIVSTMASPDTSKSKSLSQFTLILSIKSILLNALNE